MFTVFGCQANPAKSPFGLHCTFPLCTKRLGLVTSPHYVLNHSFNWGKTNRLMKQYMYGNNIQPPYWLRINSSPTTQPPPPTHTHDTHPSPTSIRDKCLAISPASIDSLLYKCLACLSIWRHLFLRQALCFSLYGHRCFICVPCTLSIWSECPSCLCVTTMS